MARGVGSQRDCSTQQQCVGPSVCPSVRMCQVSRIIVMLRHGKMASAHARPRRASVLIAYSRLHPALSIFSGAITFNV